MVEDHNSLWEPLRRYSRLRLIWFSTGQHNDQLKGDASALKCEDFEDTVSEYIDGDLSPAYSMLLEQHLVECESCYRMLEGVRGVRVAIQNLGSAPAPPHFRLNLASCLNAGLQRSSVWGPSLAVGVTIVVAMAILLWPQPGVEDDYIRPTPSAVWATQAAAWTFDDQADRPLTGAKEWYSGIGDYSPAPLRLVSY